MSGGVYRPAAQRDEGDEPTLPSIRLCETFPLPMVPWWRAVLDLVLLGGGGGTP